VVTSNSAPIGIIAGKGKFPLLFAQEAQKNHQTLIVIALKEEMNENLAPYAKAVHTVSVAKLDTIIQTLKKAGVQKAVMAGRVEHTKLFSDLIPDFRAAQLLLKIKDRRADSILGAVAEEMKKDGIDLLPSTTFLEHLLPQPGLLTKRKLSQTEQKDVEFGIKIAQGLAALDVGQTVAVKSKAVLAVEAFEGTDACIRRAASFGKEHIVVVKSAKPHQDLRFDVPIIGMQTMKVLTETQAQVLAVQANKTLMLEKEKCIDWANDHNISILAWELETHDPPLKYDQ
jgi:DUF1009 family protein